VNRNPRLLSHNEKKKFYIRECTYEAHRNECHLTMDYLALDDVQAALNRATLEQLTDLLCCLEVLKNDNLAHLIVAAFEEYVDRRILWYPFVAKDVAPYVANDGMTMLLYMESDEKFRSYVERFENHAVTLLEAETRLGLSAMLRMFSGRPLFISPSPTSGFSTTQDGAVKLPQVYMVHDSKDANLESYKFSSLHEQSHHKYNSFTINLHPDVFDYAAIGLEFVRMGEDGKTLIIKKEGNEYEVSKTEHIIALCEKPGLLKHLWNVLDDRRVDTQHISSYPGHAPLYKRENDRILASDIRKEITDDAAGMHEAFLQVMLCGKTKSPIPPEVNKKLEPVWELAGRQKLNAPDATDCFHIAIRMCKYFPDDLPENQEYKGGSGTKTTDVSDGQTVIEAPPEVGDKDGGGEPKPKPEPGEGEEGKPSKDFTYDASTPGGKIRAGWRVQEVPPQSWEPISVSPRLSSAINRVFRLFARTENGLVRPLDSGDPDIELLEEHERMEEAGMILPPDYYSGVDHTSRSVWLTLLLDLSASMGEPNDKDSKLGRALSAAKGIEDGAAMLKDDVLTLGFGGHNPTQICIVGRPGKPIRAPIGLSGSTPLGGAIRHAHARTEEARRAKAKKVAHMLVLTDGQPNVCPGEDPTYDSMKAVSDARKSGIPVFGIIFVDNEEEEARYRETYNKIFGFGNYVVLRDAESLARILKKYYQKNLLLQGEVP
jgi:hypothetical protein